MNDDIFKIFLTYDKMCDDKNILIGILQNTIWRYYIIMIILIILLVGSITYIIKREWGNNGKKVE